MKIINDNKLHLETFSASNESLNYPASNLDHPFLTKRFQATTNTSEIQIDLATKATIDAIGYGHTNATSGSIKLYTEAASVYTLVETVTIDLDYDPCISYTTTSRDNIARVIFDLTTTDTYLYLGGVAAGEHYEIDYSDAYFERPLIDNSLWQPTNGGQSLSNKQTALRVVPLTFGTENLTAANALITVYRALGIGAVFFADIFPGSRTLLPPLYCCFSAVPRDTGPGTDRTISINLQECN